MWFCVDAHVCESVSDCGSMWIHTRVSVCVWVDVGDAHGSECGCACLRCHPSGSSLWDPAFCIEDRVVLCAQSEVNMCSTGTPHQTNSLQTRQTLWLSLQRQQCLSSCDRACCCDRSRPSVRPRLPWHCPTTQEPIKTQGQSPLTLSLQFTTLANTIIH